MSDRTRIGPATARTPAPAVYRPGQASPCPTCGQSQWYVGRHTAECACCATALPLTGPQRWFQPAPATPARAA